MRLYNCDIYRFAEFIRNKKLVCFGAGKMLRSFLDDYKEMHIDSNILYIADNSQEKAGTVFSNGYLDIPVIGLRELLLLENVILLISCNDIAGIYEQLDAYPQMENWPCFAIKYIRSETNQKAEREREYSTTYRRTKEPLIPKKIHYCWFGKGEIPDQNKRWMESWSKYCPDYEIIRWDESNYDVTKNKYMYEAYQAGKWGFVPDYARMDIIYNNGGIYLDTDVELLKGLDELLYQQAFAGVDGSKNINLGVGFGAEKNLPILKEAMNFYETLIFYKEDRSYNLTDGPKLMKEFFNKKAYVNDGKYQVIGGMAVYPEKVLSAKCNYTRRILPNEHTIAVHHFDCSWAPEYKKQNIKNAGLLKRAIIL